MTGMMRYVAASLLVLTSLSLQCLAAGAQRVRLTAHERVGVARDREPVSAGVPFPPNAVATNDVELLGLKDASGKRVPAQIRITNRWWNHPGQPVRWVLVDFQPSVAANGTAEYFLCSDMPAESSKTPLRLDEERSPDGTLEKVTIVTGPLKFTVKRRNFNIIDEAWLDESGAQAFAEPNRIVSPHSRGAVIFAALSGNATNKYYLASNDDKGTLEVEERGPMRITLKLTGRHLSKDGLSGPEQMLDYICRIHAFAGSPTIQVSYVLACRQGSAVDQGLPMDGMFIELPLALKATTYALGKHKGVARGELAPNARAYCLADSSDRCEFGGAAAALGVGHTKNCLPLKYRWVSDKPGSLGARQPGEKETPMYGDTPYGLGWVDASDGARGVAGGIRWFWELWPKAVEARNAESGASALRFHLWANVNETVLPAPQGWSPSMDSIVSASVKGRANMFPGMSKTHDLFLHFHGKADDAQLERAWYGLAKPVRAICDPSWYCEKARAWDMIPSSSPEIYKPEDLKIVQAYDARLKEWLEFIKRFRAKQYGAYDSYGTFHFGNNINFVQNRNQPTPLDILWDNHYYDYPHAVFLQFARTGDPDILESAVESDVNLADVAMCCWNPDPELIGCSRYSPSADMIRRDAPPHPVYTPHVYSWHRCNFDRWWLMGDRHAYDMNYLFADYVRRHSKVLNQCNVNEGHMMRSRGHMMRNLCIGYIATGEPTFLAAAKFIYYGPIGWRGSDWKPNYQYGIALEGYYQWHLASGDLRSIRSLTSAGDQQIEGINILPYGIAAIRTGNRSLYNIVREKFTNFPGTKLMWGAVQDFGLQLRSAPYALWALTDPDKLPHRENPPDVHSVIVTNLDGTAKIEFDKLQPPSSSGAPTKEWLTSAQAVPDLIIMLNSPTEDVREMAATLLGRLGTAAKDALPVLKERQTRDENAKVKLVIGDAIRQIEGSAVKPEREELE